MAIESTHYNKKHIRKTLVILHSLPSVICSFQIILPWLLLRDVYFRQSAYSGKGPDVLDLLTTEVIVLFMALGYMLATQNIGCAEQFTVQISLIL